MPTKSPFEKALAKLIDHLRRDPHDAAKTTRLTRTARKAVSREDATIQAGLVLEDTDPDPGVQGRMHARGIESIVVRAGAPDAQIQALGEALASDEGELPSIDMVAIQLVETITPREHAEDPGPAADGPLALPADVPAGARAPRLAVGPEGQIAELRAAIRDAANRGAWTDALHAAQALTHVTEQATDDTRRQLGIAARRALSPGLLRGFIDHAIRVAEERPRTAIVLDWAGRDGVEVVVDALKETGTIGPKQFLFDLVADKPDVMPYVEPLLSSPAWHEVRLGALLMGRVGDDEGISALASQQRHSDVRVRLAVVAALGRIGSPGTVEPLKTSLNDPATDVRIAAAEALGARGPAAGVVTVLAGALQQEKDQAVRLALIDALGRIDTGESATALAAVALSRPRPFLRRGYRRETRLAAVAALAGLSSRGARSALERVAEEGRGAVSAAARQALAHPGREE